MAATAGPWSTSTTSPTATFASRSRAPVADCLRHTETLIAIQGADQKSGADGEYGNSCGDLSRILLGVALGLVASVAQILASGIEIVLHVDVLHRGAEIVDHLFADAQLSEELLQPSGWKCFAAMRAGRSAGRHAAVGGARGGESCVSRRS